MYKLAAAVLVALVASACGSRPTAAQVVPIELTEFAIHSPISVFKVGVPYHFVISNPGAINHEFVLLAEGEEHHMQEAGHVEHSEAGPRSEAAHHGHDSDMDHEMSGGMLHVGESQLTPGNTVTVEYTFSEPGEYVFGCYLPGHYEAGMHTVVTVMP